MNGAIFWDEWTIYWGRSGLTLLYVGTGRGRGCGHDGEGAGEFSCRALEATAQSFPQTSHGRGPWATVVDRAAVMHPVQIDRERREEWPVVILCYLRD